MLLRNPYTGLLILVAMLNSGCSEYSISPKKDSPVVVQSKGEFCIKEPDEILAYTKILFVVDKSGSNAGSGGTDPNAVKRAGNIERFIQQNQFKSEYRWGMIAFNSGEISAYINYGSDSDPKFTASIDEALNAIQRLRTEADNNQTPYKDALLSAKLAIQTDITLNRDERSSYQIFFVSDGDPSDQNFKKTWKQVVDEVVTGHARPVTLSTAFYGTNGNTAKLLLSQMAQRGNGRFVDFESNESWDFNDLIVPPTVEPWQLKELLVYNLNSGYCLDGTLGLDSDGDGLCDKDEASALGFDPTNRFSFGDGYSDLFHWRRLRYGEALVPCTDSSDEDHDLLTACEEAHVFTNNPIFGLPEKLNRKNPDTDLDGIIDGLEVRVYFSKSLAFALDPLHLLNSQFDGEEAAGVQIKQHRNPLNYDPEQIAYDTKYRLRPDQDVGKDCYDFTQDVLPLYPTQAVGSDDELSHVANENIVLIYYIQTPQNNPNGKGVLRYSLQKLQMGQQSGQGGLGSGLKVNDRVFKTYVVPE